MEIQGQTVSTAEVPILIYVPAMGTAENNSASRIADVVAKVADRLDDTVTFGTKTAQGVSTPRGLSLGKTVVDGSDQPKLQLFQFNYASILKISQGTALPSVVPGMFRTSFLAGWASMKWVRAFRHKAKTARTKAQLALGLGTALVLIFVALMSIYALLIALGFDMPWLTGVLGPEAASWTFGFSALGLTITWALARKKILAVAETAERLIRFTKNHGKTADTISTHLDDAIDDLRANGWRGPVHLLGYSFGSLVVFECMYPRVNANLAAEPVKDVESIVTIACPLDLVRLFEPTYDKQRQGRKKNLPWTNIFNEADIFASNLREGDDSTEGRSFLISETATPNSIRYLDETIGLFQIFINERTHSSYWGLPEEASCFAKLVPQWLSEQWLSDERQEGSAKRQ